MPPTLGSASDRCLKHGSFLWLSPGAPTSAHLPRSPPAQGCPALGSSPSPAPLRTPVREFSSPKAQEENFKSLPNADAVGSGPTCVAWAPQLPSKLSTGLLELTGPLPWMLPSRTTPAPILVSMNRPPAPRRWSQPHSHFVSLLFFYFGIFWNVLLLFLSSVPFRAPWQFPSHSLTELGHVDSMRGPRGRWTLTLRLLGPCLSTGVKGNGNFLPLESLVDFRRRFWVNS